LIGAIPTAYILGKLIKRVDLRREGSGNIGATNAWRVLGKKIGIATLIVDMLKGLLAVILISRIFPFKIIEDSFMRSFLCGLAAIIGHNFPIYLKFKGGKGVATSAGVVAGLAPAALGAAFVIWILVLFLTGYVSVASILAGVSLPLFSIVFGYPQATRWFSFLLCIFVIVQHRSNIRRLLKREEKKFLKS
jgi:glycerol-3-phosphate acyltransferase PlsY